MLSFISTDQGKWLWTNEYTYLVHVKTIYLFKIEHTSSSPPEFVLKAFVKGGTSYLIGKAKTQQELVDILQNDIPSLSNAFMWDLQRKFFFNRDEIISFRCEASGGSFYAKCDTTTGSTYIVSQHPTDNECRSAIQSIIM
jgi:hypothetical protein